VFQSGGNKLTIDDGGNKLLGNVKFFDVAMITIGDDDVDRIALGDDELRLERVLGDVESDGRALVHSKVGDDSLSLNFETVAVDDLNTRDDIVENDGSLAAAINGDGVDLSSGHVDNRVLKLVAIQNVLGFSIRDNDVLVALVPFNDPFVTLELRQRRSGGSSRGGSSARSSSSLGGTCSRNNTTGAELGVLVGLHVLGDLLETTGDTISLVQRGEEVSTGISSSSTGITGFDDRGRRRARRRGRRSSTSSGGRGARDAGRLGITTVGVPVESLGVVLVNVGLEFSEEVLEGIDPLDLIFIGSGGSCLELGEERVEIEDGTIKALLNDRSWKTVHHGITLGPKNPLKSGNRFGDGGDVIEIIISSARNTLGTINLVGSLEELGDCGNFSSVGGLLALSGDLDDVAELSNGGSKVAKLGLQAVRTNGVGDGLEGLEVISNEIIIESNERMDSSRGGRGGGRGNRTGRGGRGSATGKLSLNTLKTS
jgi:hypothetical protein